MLFAFSDGEFTVHTMVFGLVLCLLVTASVARSEDTWGNYSLGDDFSSSADVEKIINGVPANINKYPYMVSLVAVGQYGSNMHFCGGSIISNSWVLSAAHCAEIFDQVQVAVSAGSSFWDQGKIHKVAEYTIHENYRTIPTQNGRRLAVANDIAVIKVTNPFQWSTTVNSVALPTSLRHPWKTGLLTGWGYTSIWTDADGEIQGTSPRQLMVTGVIFQNIRKCRGVFQPEGMMCTTHKTNWLPSSACAGDSGGPLVSIADSVQVGLVSHGNGNCPPGGGVVYTDVAFYRRWIRDNTGV